MTEIMKCGPLTKHDIMEATLDSSVEGRGTTENGTEAEPSDK